MFSSGDKQQQMPRVVWQQQQEGEDLQRCFPLCWWVGKVTLNDLKLCWIFIIPLYRHLANVHTIPNRVLLFPLCSSNCQKKNQAFEMLMLQALLREAEIPARGTRGDRSSWIRYHSRAWLSIWLWSWIYFCFVPERQGHLDRIGVLGNCVRPRKAARRLHQHFQLQRLDWRHHELMQKLKVFEAKQDSFWRSGCDSRWG